MPLLDAPAGSVSIRQQADGIRGSRRAFVVATRSERELTPLLNFLPKTMLQLPEAKLDALLARHAALEAELLGQVNSDEPMSASRANCRTDAGGRRRESLSRRRGGNRRHRRADRRSRDRRRDARHGGKREAASWKRARRTGAADPHRAAAEGRDGRAQRGARNPRRHRRRRGLAVRGRPVPHVRALRGACRAGRSRRSPPARAPWAATRKSSPKCRAAAPSPN